jgi:pyridoxal phosphate enzyme (YggS family)
VSIAASLADVRARIADAARAAGRDPGAITLVAVSKAHAPEAIREAYAAGQRVFGESYAQELETKAAALTDLDIAWHFVGHLQSNKAKSVVRVAKMVHTVHSRDLAAELGKRASAVGRAPLAVLVEVKLSEEASKHGVSSAALGELLDTIERDTRLILRGLMTMPPPDDEAAKRVFDALVTLQSAHGGPKRLPELSMGMSHDLEIAIARGATMVRIGTAIFSHASRVLVPDR